ncbi:MAG: hypothetical protein V3W20_11250 [Candidatus Neomarinimicrobiota bacterium]
MEDSIRILRAEKYKLQNAVSDKFINICDVAKKIESIDRAIMAIHFSIYG